jgi:hypothetical protein
VDLSVGVVLVGGGDASRLLAVRQSTTVADAAADNDQAQAHVDDQVEKALTPQWRARYTKSCV